MPDRPEKRKTRLRPDLPGGRGKREPESAEEERRRAMSGRGDDRRHKSQEGNTGRKKRGFGDQGAWN